MTKFFFLMKHFLVKKLNLNISKWVIFDILRYNFFYKKKSLKKTVILSQKMKYSQNIKHMIIMEKSLWSQLTFIFDHRYIHYTIFEHLSILRKYMNGLHYGRSAFTVQKLYGNETQITIKNTI